ncbi:propionate catabolism operon regulatory protein PrpR [Marinobacter sp. ANT_B65]|uniref:propionate catabolism operon regulatory protein PrpR n=1 Tax=Marinobacter sp. ANT_B65 TaxID=2039467 RepID=UPI000BBE6481|nr:propionate catabolism operon regulatory protein PrpR [Marinobacter sp. ANT_B65]PCM43231.1 propionate catabolism operon regulatory protein PrpR [Marinobacter sp. ANT_B65]
MPAESRKPRIIALISHLTFDGHPSKLTLTLNEILPRYEQQADIQIVETSVDKLLATAKSIEQEQRADILICSGASAEFLRKKIAITILSFRMGEYDLIRAINLARERGTKAGILTHQRTLKELEEMSSLFTVEVSQAVYTSLQDAREKIQTFVDEGYRVIIGSPTVVELAEAAGAEGVFAINADAVRLTLDDALAICHSRTAEEQKHRRIHAVLKNLNEGVIALDATGTVFSVNTSMNTLLQPDQPISIGDRATEHFPDIDIKGVLTTGTSIESRLSSRGSQRLAISVVPIMEEGQIDGAILTCQEIREIQRAERRLRSQSRPSHLIARYHFEQLAGEERSFQQAVHLAKLYAHSNSTVLITGESGTGKELFAQSIHNASNRQQMPFVAINCAAFPETLLESELFGYDEGAFTGTRKGGKPGLFEAAHNGTIFLDEIGDMPIHLQTRLLRVLQERQVLRLGGSEPTPINIRVIAATHRDLQQEIANNRFREDLFYRLNILRISVPPLRQRASDIPSLTRLLVKNLAGGNIDREQATNEILNTLMPQLMKHKWSGNIRELENLIERAFLMSQFPEESQPLEALFPELFSMPTELRSTLSVPKESLQDFGKAAEITLIQETLDAHNGDMTKTAKALGISRSTLWRRLRQPHAKNQK